MRFSSINFILVASFSGKSSFHVLFFRGTASFFAQSDRINASSFSHGTPHQERIELLLVSIHQKSKSIGQRENHMKILDGQYVFILIEDPPLFFEELTFRALSSNRLSSGLTTLVKLSFFKCR